MEDGFDVVAVGIEHVGRVVPRVVLRAEPRAAVVLTPRGDRGLVEAIDRAEIGCRERDVNGRGGLTLRDREVLASLGPEGDLPALELDGSSSERADRGLVETPAGLEIANPD